MAKYKFEQIAINSTEKKKPVEQDRFAYIGLEHMDPGCLNVTRFGTEVAPVGEKLIMHKGDVLFGKRRAYQKKVAIAPFDGIFSAHGMVLRPREDIIDRRFFPLFISSDYFLDAAIKISVGSLSPTINWRDLKELEFELPDLDRQRKLAEVLWAINDAVESYKKLLDATDELVKARFVEMFGDPISNPYGWEKVHLSELADIKIGPFGSLLHKDDYVEGGHPLVNPSHIKDGKIVTNNKLTISDKKYKEMTAYHLQIGDVVMGRRGEMGRCAVVDQGGLLCGTGSILIRSKGEITADYIQKIISFPSFKKVIEDMAVGQTMSNLNVPIVSNFDIIMPPIKVQYKYYSFVHQTDRSKSELEQALSELTATYKRILSENLG